MKGFKITYEIITHESAEDGEAAERGWIDEEGVDLTVEPDDLDWMDDITNAVDFLMDAGAWEPSSSPGSIGLHGWFTADGYNHDLRTGATENRSFHPVGYSEAELEEITARVLKGRHG